MNDPASILRDPGQLAETMKELGPFGATIPER